MIHKHNSTKPQQRVVIKIGSSLITAAGQGLDTRAIQHWADQIAGLIANGHQPILVSSGAVAAGMLKLNWKTRPANLHEQQAAAAIGQMGLIEQYETAFQRHKLLTAQILLSHHDLADRSRYLNARNTLKTLLSLSTVPIVNENDPVASDELRFGDNDTLAAMVANLIEADILLIMTDQAGLFDADPRLNPAAKLIAEANANDANLAALAGPSRGPLGRGGMISKLQAARIAARSGTDTIILAGNTQNSIQRVLQGEAIGTRLHADQAPLAARKQWLAVQLPVQGDITLDDGAVKVLLHSGRSLLPVGVTAVKGQFQRGALVRCIDNSQQEIARGLINYNAEETRIMQGQPSHKLTELLGYQDDPELIHRDNLVITRPELPGQNS